MSLSGILVMFLALSVCQCGYTGSRYSRIRYGSRRTFQVRKPPAHRPPPTRQPPPMHRPPPMHQPPPMQRPPPFKSPPRCEDVGGICTAPPCHTGMYSMQDNRYICYRYGCVCCRPW